MHGTGHSNNAGVMADSTKLLSFALQILNVIPDVVQLAKGQLANGCGKATCHLQHMQHHDFYNSQMQA